MSPERQKDDMDLRICELMDAAPYGAGLSGAQCAEQMAREYPGHTFTRNSVNSQWDRVRKAMEKHS